MRFRWTRPLPGASRDCPGRVTGAHLVKDRLGWHITTALSTGETFSMRSLLTPGEQRRLRGLERKAARQQLATKQQRASDPTATRSKRQSHTYSQIAALWARQARRREDWLHKTTTDLAKSHGVVVVEDPRIRNLARSARGTIEDPGSNVRAKAGLNRSILGMAWGKAGRMLAYRCPLHAAMLVTVDPRNSSVECAGCGHTSPDNRISQATFRCLACRHEANADTNAAQVLLERGLTALGGATPGCGGTAREARSAVPHRGTPARHARPALVRRRPGESSPAK